MADQRYRVLKRLEAGGMAEVFVGEATSVQGFKKKVAIKKVLPHLAENRNFIAMFLDEARLGARLNHANIVSVFDIGRAQESFFLVMEYVDGINLKSALETMRKQGRVFGLREASYICMEACRGLSYAHELADERDHLIGIVHRDVSPPNILLSRRGEVKVTDFGLAKATTQLESTDPGVVKGKFGYLSPEAVLGEEVDARADLFALGIILWEMLAGRRLFLGDTDYETVQLVQKAHIPDLRHFNKHIDDEFQALLLKMLAQDRNQRFQSARELGSALADYLFSHKLKVTAYDVANMVKNTLGSRRSTGSQSQPIIDQLILEEIGRFTPLDDLSDPLQGAEFAPLSADEDGTMPLDAHTFRRDRAHSLQPSSKPAPSAEQQAIRKATQQFDLEASPGGLANLLESDSSVSELRLPSAQPGQRRTKPSHTLLIVLTSIAMIAVGAAALAWKLNWLP